MRKEGLKGKERDNEGMKEEGNEVWEMYHVSCDFQDARRCYHWNVPTSGFHFSTSFV